MVEVIRDVHGTDGPGLLAERGWRGMVVRGEWGTGLYRLHKVPEGRVAVRFSAKTGHGEKPFVIFIPKDDVKCLPTETRK